MFRQRLLVGLSMPSIYLLRLKLSARTSSCEVLGSLAQHVQTTRNVFETDLMHWPRLVLSTLRRFHQLALDLPSHRVPSLLIRVAKRSRHLDARLPTVICLRGFLRLPRQQTLCGRLLTRSACVSRWGHRIAACKGPIVPSCLSFGGGHVLCKFGCCAAGSADFALLVCVWAAIARLGRSRKQRRPCLVHLCREESHPLWRGLAVLPLQAFSSLWQHCLRAVQADERSDLALPGGSACSDQHSRTLP